MARKEVIQIRCSEIEKERWKGVAATEHLELSAWIRLVLDKTSRLSEARTAIGNKPDAPIFPDPDESDPWLHGPNS